MLVSVTADRDRRGSPLRQGSGLPQLWRLSSLGLELGLCVAIGILGGWWLDRYLGTGGWVILAGLGIGLVAAVRSFILRIREVQREDDRDDE